MSGFKAKNKMYQIQFLLGLRPDPAGGAYSAPPDPVAGLRGLLLRGGTGRERRGDGKRRGGDKETRGHGRNFGLKSGSTNCEGERGALGSRDERGRRVSHPIRLGGLVRSGASSSSRKRFYCNLISADRLC